MAYDHSNMTSRTKLTNIQHALKNHIQGLNFLSPNAVGFSDYQDMAPTIEIAHFQVSGINSKELEVLIKKAVYKPGNSKKDMFRLKSHGVIC